MNPGRELDKLIAEKVMGYIIDHDNDRHFSGIGIARNKDELAANATLPGLPHYSTKIEDAWLVVEKLLPKDDEFF